MRAKSINEESKGLKIYKNNDGSYSAKRNDTIYSFYWKPYSILNFKKIGKVNKNYTISGKLISNPPIQMILQAQKNINESISDILKPKPIEDTINDTYKGPGTYCLAIEFLSGRVSNNSLQIKLLNIKQKQELSDLLINLLDIHNNSHYVLSLYKFDMNKDIIMDYYPSSGIDILSKGSIKTIIKSYTHE